MKKICVITIIDNNNYGNRLQNIASNLFLKQLGYDVQSGIELFVKDSWIEYSGNQFKKVLKRITPLSFVRLRDNYVQKKESSKNIRTKRIRDYTEKIISVMPKVYFDRVVQIKDYFEKASFDYYIIGSDQVWNPNWYTKEYEYLYYLDYADDSKKMCFAPSFGVDSIPEPKKELLRNRLLSFKNLNVREESGKQIINDLTGRMAKVIIDPTLIIDTADWIKLSEKPRGIDFNQPYILAYFLGGISNQAKKLISTLCQENGLILLDMFDKNNISIYTSNPGEFLYLIRNAQIILTDSFHASVFSFLFEKPFIVFDRQSKTASMNGRIITLLRKFDLMRKYANSGLKNDLFECDYRIGYSVLQQERENTTKYFIDMLEGKF